MVESIPEVSRMIDQGAVKNDGEKASNRNLEIQMGETHIYQICKRRFAKIKITVKTPRDPLPA